MATTSLGNFVVLDTTYDDTSSNAGTMSNLSTSLSTSNSTGSVIAMTVANTTTEDEPKSTLIPTVDDNGLGLDLSASSNTLSSDEEKMITKKPSKKITIASSPNTVNFFPEPMEVSEEENDDDESDEDADEFDPQGVPLPRVSSSTIPIVLEVAPRNGRLASNDPLFQGVCLYSGSMSTDQVEAYSTTLGDVTDQSKEDSTDSSGSSWFGSFSPSQWLK